jgi:hypothetical protein
VLNHQIINKRWSDNRLDQWQPTPGFEVNLFNFQDRIDRLRVVPMDEVYRNGDKIELGFYQMPTGETVKRITFDYDFQQEGKWTPDAAKYNNDPGGANTFADMDNTLDDDDTTYSAITITTDDYIYIGTSKPRWSSQFIRVDMGSVVNANASVLTCEYSQGAGVWAAQAITDGTAVGGATFAQDSFITIVPNKDWLKESVDGKTVYWLRFEVSANLTANIRFVAFEFTQNQTWKLALWNNTSAANEWQVTSSASGSEDITLATPDDNPGFYFASDANQHSFGNGTVYGEISNIVVYSETGAISVTAVVTDVHGLATYLNSFTRFIGSNTLSVEPFVTEGYESLASILERTAAYGDASGNRWHAYLKHSEEALVPDGKPVLALEAYPVLTDHDYAVRVDEENVAGGINIVQDNANIANYIIVSFRNITSDKDEFITPDDQATLTNAASVTKYGERHKVITLGTMDATSALAYGVTYLTEFKDPKFYVSGAFSVRGYIRAKNNQEVPAANIRAGKRVKIDNYMYDLTSTANAGFIAIISETSYTDNDQTCSVSFGIQDDAGLIIARSIAAGGASTGLSRSGF